MKIKKFFSFFLALLIFFEATVIEINCEEKKDDALEMECKSCILMEASTGKVIYENNSDEQLSPASITKIMTLLLIFEAIEDRKIELSDMVTTSEYAMSMGGSQVFLEAGETQTVDTLIKCIAVASGNDACVAMAEYISGSETAFVDLMNKKAEELKMKNTHFEDCCGLSDSDNHYSSARDVAIMSRELITKYPQVFDYTTIWMENIVHRTKKGETVFGLSSTNKLLKQYPYTTGLKTGSTSKAKYCLSATARKDNMDLIAVVMASPDYKKRVTEAKKLLEYGYANSTLYRDLNDSCIQKVNVTGGEKNIIGCRYAEAYTYLCTGDENVKQIEKKIEIQDNIEAPVKKGTKIGEAKYYLNGKEIGSVPLLADESVKKAGFSFYLKKTILVGIPEL